MRKRIIAVIIAAVMITLPGCAAVDRLRGLTDEYSEQSEEDLKPTQEPKAQTEIKNQIRLVAYNVDTYMPLATKSQSVRDCMQLVYEPLFQLDEDMMPEPVLATGYEVSDDGLTLTVGIKSGVKWHDGTELSAMDVLYSAKLAMDPDSYFYRNMQSFTSASVSGGRLVFKLGSYIPEAAALLDFPIVKNGTKTDAGEEYIPVGTGPFRYSYKKSVDEIQFNRNDDWHKGSVKAKYLVVKEVSNRENAQSLFDAGQIDAVTDDIVDLKSYTPRGNVSINDFATNNLIYIGMNFYKSQLWGADTRKAISKAVDRSDISVSVMYGRAYTADMPVNPTACFAPNTDSKMTADQEYARELLISDGWTEENGRLTRSRSGTEEVLSLTLLVNGDNEEKVQIAEKIEQSLENIGIDITVDQRGYDEYVNMIQSRSFDLYIGETNLRNNHDISMLLYSGRNPFAYSNEEMDECIRGMSMAADRETLIALYEQCVDIFDDETPFAPLMFEKGSAIYGANVKVWSQPNVSNSFYRVETWEIG